MKRLLRFFETRINPYPDTDIHVSGHSLLGFIWQCTSGLRGWALLLITLSALIGVFEALLYAWMGDIVDWINTYGATAFWDQNQLSLLIMLLVLLISPMLVFLNAAVLFQSLQGVFPMRLRWIFHRLMLGQSMQFFQDEMSGRVSAKVMQTALAVREVVMTMINIVAYVGVYFVSTGVILIGFDGWLLVPFVCWALLYISAMYYFVPRLKLTSLRQADARALMTGRVTDAYANISTVKLFSHTQREQNYTKEAMEEFMTTVHAQMRYVTGFEVCNHIINTTLIGTTAALGIYLWQENAVSVGAVAAATALALRVNGLSHWIMWQVAALFENLGTVEDGMRTFTKPVHVMDHKNALPLRVMHGHVHFDHVDFAYSKKNVVLEGFNLTIEPGEKIGLIGRSGAGKSTLVNLLLRFYDIDQGAIIIDNQNIADVTQESLRQQIGMVTQDTSLLHRSIKDNIAYGSPEATKEQIIAAAKAAQAHEFITCLSDNKGRTGYDTMVGERGVKLSGGQRQRIAIARVMLKNAPILLLDEATSALDSEIENAITASLDRLMEGKTVIAIAHRLSTIAALDRLVVLDHGQIIEQGTHQELINQQGVYAHLWAHQSGGFLAID